MQAAIVRIGLGEMERFCSDFFSGVQSRSMLIDQTRCTGRRQGRPPAARGALSRLRTAAMSSGLQSRAVAAWSPRCRPWGPSEAPPMSPIALHLAT